MKATLPDLTRWLALAAVADWLLARTVTRLAIHMPKSPLVIAIYQGLGFAGQAAGTLTALLALVVLAWVGWRTGQGSRRIGSGLLATSLIGLSLLFLFVAPAGWLAVSYHGLLLGAIAFAGGQVLGSALDHAPKGAGALVALALAFSAAYQAGPVFYAAFRWPGPPPLSALLFNAGELLAVLCPVALWWAYGRGATRREWLIAGIPVIAFTGLHLASAAMAGILAIWSTGLTLYLPWPLYALSLWLASVTVMATLRRGEPPGWALLLLIAGGYAPQLSTQAFLGLIALHLLALPHALDPSISPTADGLETRVLFWRRHVGAA